MKVNVIRDLNKKQMCFHSQPAHVYQKISNEDITEFSMNCRYARENENLRRSRTSENCCCLFIKALKLTYTNMEGGSWIP